ncbi:MULTISPECIES: CHRD domain-containing protein [Hymenobacter]|uniref:CHRD domain-containing protein n=1 Tax=Hymenobacter TaxID=89966 RepID=UPI0010588273|nr:MULTISPECIES: CHRD domain-containing protein [Hymenobacter]QIL76522.1 CHRD domain-containing protein [Hymenobacter sp. HDW8]
MLNKLTGCCLLALGSVAFSACDQFGLEDWRGNGQPAPRPKIALTSPNMDARQVVNGPPSRAIGTYAGLYDPQTNVLVSTIGYSVEPVLSAHLHRGQPGTNGPIVFSFPSLTHPVGATVTLSEEDEVLLLNNGMYVDVHTPIFPQGELRGPVRRQ